MLVLPQSVCFSFWDWLYLYVWRAWSPDVLLFSRGH